MNTKDKKQILKDIEARKQQFLASYSNKHKFLSHTFDGEIKSVTRKSDKKTFRLDDEIYNTDPTSYGVCHKIAKFEIKQRYFSRVHKSGVDEIWLTYDNNAGGTWLCDIDFYINKNKTMKEKLKNWWKTFVKNHIAMYCPKHLDDLF